MKRQELFWLLVPCLFLAGAALWMRAREQRGQAANFNGPFRIFIERIEKRPISAKDAADGYDTQVVAVLHHTGKAPVWWGKQSGNSGSSDNNGRLFYEAAGKAHAVKLPPGYRNDPDIFYWRPGWKSDSSRYEARFFLKLAKLPPRSEKTVLRAKVAVEDVSTFPRKFLSAAVPLEYVVRASKETIRPAQVSREPMLDVNKIEIRKPGPAEQKTNGGYDTEVQVYLQDQGKDESGSDSIGGEELLNERGGRVLTGPGWSMSSGARTIYHPRPILNYQFRMKSMPSREKIVILKTKFSRGDRWPLRLRIPLRQGGKDSKGLVQALPWKEEMSENN